MNIQGFHYAMDEMLQALLLFWIPIAMVPLGLWLSMSSASKSTTAYGKYLAFLGIIMICLSPWTVPSSPSSAAGHLLGAIIGPCMLIIISFHFLAMFLLANYHEASEDWVC